MSTKQDKFKNLMRSPAGSQNNKIEIIKDAELANSPANELVQISGKKKATFELDAELHRWLKLHALTINKDMVQIVEDLLRKYRSDIERR